jgi:hypothetical protein
MRRSIDDGYLPIVRENDATGRSRKLEYIINRMMKHCLALDEDKKARLTWQ